MQHIQIILSHGLPEPSLFCVHFTDLHINHHCYITQQGSLYCVKKEKKKTICDFNLLSSGVCARSYGATHTHTSHSQAGSYCFLVKNKGKSVLRKSRGQHDLNRCSDSATITHYYPKKRRKKLMVLYWPALHNKIAKKREIHLLSWGQRRETCYNSQTFTSHSKRRG